eukprot:gene59555-79464_t
MPAPEAKRLTESLARRYSDAMAAAKKAEQAANPAAPPAKSAASGAKPANGQPPAKTAAPAGLAAPAVQAAVTRGGVDVRIATTETFSRVEVRGARASVRQDGKTITLTLDRDGDPDISRLRTSPPKWFKTAEKRRAKGRLQLILTIADDAEVKVGTADGATYINAFEKVEVPEPSLETPQVEVAEAEPVRANPLPPSGVVRVESKVAGSQTQPTFPLANPAGATVV